LQTIIDSTSRSSAISQSEKSTDTNSITLQKESGKTLWQSCLDYARNLLAILGACTILFIAFRFILKPLI